MKTESEIREMIKNHLDARKNCHERADECHQSGDEKGYVIWMRQAGMYNEAAVMLKWVLDEW